MVKEEVVSDYEKLRAENIARNQGFLQSIGIDPSASTLMGEAGRKKGATAGKKRPKWESDKGSVLTQQKGSRKSSRINTALRDPSEKFLEIGPDGLRGDWHKEGDSSSSSSGCGGARVREQKHAVMGELAWDLGDLDGHTARRVTPQQLLEFIETQSEDHYAGISAQQVQHCVMRMNSMTVKAFSNRVKQIARHAGQHSFEKLLVAFYAVQLAQVPALEGACRDALTQIGVVLPSGPGCDPDTERDADPDAEPGADPDADSGA